MKLSSQGYKGTRDFYPEDKRLQKYLFSTWRKVVESYGYEEYDGPMLEETEIYRAKSGEELVDQQSYRFEDRGGRDVTMRPEMTPTVARMVAARRQELSYPARWYSIPNLWRYERPQRGRLREHWQLNVDIFGVETIDAELELISIAHDLMSAIGATDDMYTIKVNSRQLTAIIMADYLELDGEKSHHMMKLLDRRAKMEQSAFEEEAMQIMGTQEGVNKLKELVEAKSMGDLPEQIREAGPVRQIQLLFTHLRDNRITNVNFDVSLMRGFDYYTDIVFEVFDNSPDNNRSLFGGGRYDGLVGMFGVEPVPTAGFGVGDVTMLDFLEVHNLKPEPRSETDVYIVAVGDVLRQAQGVARLLRQAGLNVALDISTRKADKKTKSGVAKHVPYLLFVGEEELNQERFILRNVKTQEEEKLSLEEISQKVKP